MTAPRQRRAPSLVGLAPILFLLLLILPAPAASAETAAVGDPPTAAQLARDPDWNDNSPGVVYVVQPGDTLSAIARQFGTRVAAVQLANGLGDTTLILIGQRLKIPVIPPALAPANSPSVRRGLAMAVPRPEDAAELGVGWYYNWQWCAAAGCVPMVYRMEAPPACAPIILVGNEPNAIQPFGWPVTPTLAAERVRAIEVQCPGARLVVGNVAADDWRSAGGWGSGHDWLAAFLAAYARYARRDFHQTLGVHCYSQAETGYCLGMLAGMRALYDGPMWVTEFGILSGSPDEFLGLLKYVAAHFERFAAYTNRQPHTGQGWELSTGVEMVQGDGSLTPVGGVYALWPRVAGLQVR